MATLNRAPAKAVARDEAAALLEVKKGGRLVPVILILLSAVAFVFLWLPSGREALDQQFARICKHVRADPALPATTGETTEAPPAPPPGPDYRAMCADPQGEAIEAIAAKARSTVLWEASPFATFIPKDFADESLGIGQTKGQFVMVAAYGKAFLDDLRTAFSSYWQSGLAAIFWTALYALVPGLAGLIYRRSFWRWFGISYVVLLIVRSFSTNLAQFLSPPTNAGTAAASALAAGLFLFFLTELVILLLALRLRRHATKPSALASIMPAPAYNWLLFAVLLLVAFEMFFNMLGTKPLWDGLWSVLRVDASFGWWNFLLLGLPFIYALLKATEGWQGKKPKNIVICLDGTSNTPDQYDMGLLAQTNVFKLFRMLKADLPGAFAPKGRFEATLCKSYQDKQIAFYYTGIGNKFDNDPVLGTLGMATGLGASGIIERAYLDLVRVWRPGDRVFITGFSRGAASARILSRVIDQRGAPSSMWTLNLFGRNWTLWPSRSKSKVAIDVLGCWDTVGSFGVAKTIGGINFQQLALFHDLTVPDNVEQAYHMVALDEDRQEFEPTLMDPDPIRPGRIVEVWFAGGHAGVGGGWGTDRLSDVAFDFLLSRVSSGYCRDGSSKPGDESWGIQLSAANGANAAAAAKAEEAAQAGEAVVVIHPDPLGQLRTFYSGVYTYRPRKLPLHAQISETVFERMTKSQPVYAPQSLFNYNDALDAKRDLISSKVHKLQETKSLDEREQAAVLEYADKLRMQRYPMALSAEERAEVTGALTNVA